MIDALKQIETKMQECGGDGDNEYSHIRGDSLLDDLVIVLSERCYDEEKQTVERIRSMYAKAREQWWYA